jgi:hypothetical protein
MWWQDRYPPRHFLRARFSHIEYTLYKVVVKENNSVFKFIYFILQNSGFVLPNSRNETFS